MSLILQWLTKQILWYAFNFTCINIVYTFHTFYILNRMENIYIIEDSINNTTTEERLGVVNKRGTNFTICKKFSS